MIRFRLTHPAILQALAAAGHGARILISDSNYPASTHVGPRAVRVDLNFSPGLLDAATVLEVLAEVIPIESAVMMRPTDESWPEVQQQLRARLPQSTPLERQTRHDFYAEARSPDTALLIVTGEQRRFGNILLTIGVLSPPAT